ncbi:MAG TPA: carbohydrate binding domain-containing protein [Anaerohalosphaeraceae bacterium]|nr:carbohydrate binding domain-containing protein [Anaerohalosphaeraceae bacterium]HPO70386.1 carbohydrate binding domain-containing protein [Anaerohalosphaeraceae bacterium]HRV19331.1 carbohydrate binding domain-containing protein [Anaerohalosphaeraceae bacterium]
MQKFLIVVLGGFICSSCPAAGVNLLTNGNFESGGIGWSQWWGGNSSVNAADPLEGDRCAGVWWHDDGIYQNLVLDAGTYQFGGKLMTTQTGGLKDRRIVIQVQAGGGSPTQQLQIGPGDSENIWHSVSGFITLTAPASVTVTLMLVSDLGSNPSGIGLFDDIYLSEVAQQANRNYYGAKLEPRNRVMHTAGQSAGDFNDYWNLMDIGEKPACYMTYCNLVDPFVPALRAELERYRRDYGVYLPVQLGLYIVGIENEIAAGLWDADIERFCRDLNQLGYPLYIRIGYECNGDHNHYDPIAYKAAFIRITNALRSNNVEAATVFNVIQGPYQSWYPGDAYVDWMSINAFGVWNIQHPYTPLFLNDAHARGKPVLIGEASPVFWHTDQGEASWNGDFVPYFNLINSWAGIKNFCYINTNWGGQWGDCRLQPYPIVAQHYKDQMDSALYLHGTDEVSLRADITGIIDTIPPAKINDITVTATQHGILLQWQPPADDVGINRYEILRDGILAGYNTQHYFEDTTVAAGKTCRYQITAIDKGGNRGPVSEPIMAVAAPSIDKVINGQFDQGRGPWATAWNATGLSMSSSIDSTSKLSGENSCKLIINSVSGIPWHLQYYQNLNTQAGFRYTLTFQAAADRNTSISVALQETHSPYSTFISYTADLTPVPQTFTVSGISPDKDNVNLAFMLGASAPRTIWLDAITLTETSSNPDPQNCSEVYAAGFELPADLSGDCSVDIEDLIVWAAFWLDANCGPDNGYCQKADAGLDGSVTLADWEAFCLYWLECNDPHNSSCQPTW